MIRPAIVDTNVVVAGLLSQHAASPPVRILDAMLSGGIPFVLSPELLAEYQDVLLRPKLSQLHGLSIADIDTIVADLAASACMLSPPKSDIFAPDPGDQLLLEQRTLGQQILTPRAFCQTWTEEPFPTS